MHQAIAGFAVVKSLSKTFAHVPILGGSFGPRENNIIQTAAMASGGLSNVFVSAIPALYQLNLMDTPQKDYWRIVALTAVGGYFGFFFATPRTFTIAELMKHSSTYNAPQSGSFSSSTLHVSFGSFFQHHLPPP